MAVGFSHAAVGRDIARFLIRRGYENPIVIGAQDERAILRRDAFLEEIRSCGLKDALSLDTQSPSTLEMGRKSFARLAEKGLRKAAVFCNSDWLAHGVIIEALARGFRVPEDIAVVGFGNLDFAAYSSPSLTSVHIDRTAIGLHAANMCLARLRGEEVKDKVIDVGFDIVERQSA
jgi:LacI family gluconate utilization system Gnt-I transcriptional repressor